MSRWRSLLLTLLAAMVWAPPLQAAELQMFRRDGCPWCRAWDREVLPIYGKTDLGRKVPLRMVDLDRDRSQVSLRSPIIYTPTFVLVENGRELGRIEGYPGDRFFWELLDRLLQQLTFGPSTIRTSRLSPPTTAKMGIE